MIPMQPFGSPGGASSSSSIMMSSPVGGAASPEDHDLAVLKVCLCVQSCQCWLAPQHPLTPCCATQTSIARLRQQRAQVERLKWETRQKDATIAFLRSESARLQTEVSAKL